MKFKLLTIVLSFTAFLSVLLYNQVSSANNSGVPGDSVQAFSSSNLSKLPQVETIQVEGLSYAPEIIGFGEAKAKFELSLKSDVSGKIVELNDNFVSGARIAKGSVLAKIDDTPYLVKLAQAKAQEAKALLNLQEEQRQGEVAYNDWLRNKVGGQKATPLILRKPQLEAAQAEYEYAKLAVKEAQRDLDNTKIKAPFDAVVVAVSVQPGSYVQPGLLIGQLHSISTVEVKVPLSEEQWLQLPQSISNLNDKQGYSASIFSTLDHTTSWEGKVARVERHLDADTRLRSIVISVESPLQQAIPLYSGTFVKVAIKGEARDTLYKLPASAISQQGNIWSVDESGKLHEYDASNVFSSGDYVYIESVKNKPIQVVKRPLSHFSEGMHVQTIEGALL
ncbi:efflux RND transporter periplasmic adaptor subunit [Pseudoalteromonas sp. JBTF-M23]|uniref:Efflux RND transporter periplasmic adaptor subunit n=1 Tax=Pseudoalteromonas caenipelagi TaxID=2726988 RepID=A0A849VC44_9GAMM|nr:efflux RND transporter periplasmic adaptor subunit [Pseudoalteromonas caenipelagi]NOU49271.1 efflux RND transporter periplasmic adaptor subunit [Pseudoalteromonas caenipelagi]